MVNGVGYAHTFTITVTAGGNAAPTSVIVTPTVTPAP